MSYCSYSFCLLFAASIFFNASLPLDVCSSFSFTSLVSWFHCTLIRSRTENLKLHIVELVFEFAAWFSSCIKWKFDYSFTTLSSLLRYFNLFPVLGFTLVHISWTSVLVASGSALLSCSIPLDTWFILHCFCHNLYFNISLNLMVPLMKIIISILYVLFYHCSELHGIQIEFL